MSAVAISDILQWLARERDVLYGQIFTQLLIERAVVRLTADPVLRTNLLFKGG